MDKETFFTQIEACYAQQESQEFSPVEVRGSDGVYYEYSYLINRVVRSLDSATIEEENIIKSQLGQEPIAQAIIDEVKAREVQIAIEEAARIASMHAVPENIANEE